LRAKIVPDLIGMGCGLNRSTQHFILNGKGGVYADETKIWSRIHGSREKGSYGIVGSFKK
jgi:hypothetical protein